MGIIGRLTGKELADKVDDYGKVYGEVLLGLHREVESQNRRIHDYSQEMQALLDTARSIEANVEQARKEVKDAAQEVAARLTELKSVEQRTRIAADEGASARDEARKIVTQLTSFQLRLQRQKRIGALTLWLSIAAWLTILGMGVVLWIRG